MTGTGEQPERLTSNESTREGFAGRCAVRALQGLHDGYGWDGSVREAGGMLWARFVKGATACPLIFGEGGVKIQDALSEADSQSRMTDGMGLGKPLVFERGDEGLRGRLWKQGVGWTVFGASSSKSVIDTNEYQLIEAFYGARRAARSAVPLMNHIDEGLAILATIGADRAAMRAFCLHPLIQADDDYAKNMDRVVKACASGPESTDAVAAALEYRQVANAYLSNVKMPEDGIGLSGSIRVNQMLIADKVQNKKDFDLFHKGSHPNSARLCAYFQEWIEALGAKRIEADLTALISPSWNRPGRHAKRGSLGEDRRLDLKM